MDEGWDRFSNDDYFEFTRRWLAEVCRVVRTNGNILVFGSFHNIYVIGFVLEHGTRQAHHAANHVVQTQRATQHHAAAADREHRVHYLGVQQYAGARGQVDLRLCQIEGNRGRQTIAQPVADSMHAAFGAPTGEPSFAETGANSPTDRNVVDEAARRDPGLLSRHRHDSGGRDSIGQALGGNRARRRIYRDSQEAARRGRAASRAQRAAAR